MCEHGAGPSGDLTFRAPGGTADGFGGAACFLDDLNRKDMMAMGLGLAKYSR